MQNKVKVLVAAALVVALLAVGTVSAAVAEHKYSPGDIVYTGTGNQYSVISDRVVIVSSIGGECRDGFCRNQHYRFVHARLISSGPNGEWNAPGGYAYGSMVYTSKFDEFEGEYPVYLQHAGIVHEGKNEMPSPDFSQIK
jgi:hypothetical protein